jgi:hypothetical protein
MSTIETRLARIEKEMDAAASERRAHSYTQLVRMAAGKTLEEVGPPEAVLTPGQKSIAQHIKDSVGASCAREAIISKAQGGTSTRS